MTRRRPAPLLEAAAQAYWEALQRRAAFAPKGKKRDREKDVRAFVRGALEAHALAARKFPQNPRNNRRQTESDAAGMCMVKA